MKIILIVLSVILAGVIGTGGYFIYSLTGQIDDLETDLAQSFDGLENTLNETAGRLAEADDGLHEELVLTNDALDGTKLSLTQYTETAGGRFTEIESDILGAGSQITNLQTFAEDTQNVLDSSVLQSRELYDKVHEAIVTISDGTHLLGSGFLVDESYTGNTTPIDSNMIVTAYHVVEGMTTIYITLQDGTTYHGVFMAGSKEADIAFLSYSFGSGPDLEIPDLPSVDLVDSRSVNVGDPVFIIGSPGDDEESRLLGLEGTITTGVISQINRAATIGEIRTANLLQFDAAVNFGNSGSPLFNANGDVIGVVIARISPIIGDGIGMAVTSNMIQKIAKCIGAFRGGSSGHPTIEYKYPWSGITAADISPEDVVTSNNIIVSGAKVTGISEPAMGGIEVNDIITMIDNREVNNSDEFYSFLAEYYAPGDSITLEIIRGEEELSVTLELQEKP